MSNDLTTTQMNTINKATLSNHLKLDSKEMAKMSDKLNDLLSDYHIFYQNVRGFHWNVKGENFFDLHVRFEELYTQLYQNIDELAERIVTIGFVPLHSYAFKPNAFGMNNTDAEIAYGMKAAKALGASHVTLEHPSDDAHTLKLGKMGEQYGMSIGYHGHEQETFGFWDTAIAQSPKNGLNLDAGHYIAAGQTDLIPLIEKQHSRILSMHTKDRTTPAHGKGNVAWGSGDTPIPQLLKMMKSNKYKFPATIEIEYQIPEVSDAGK